MNKPSLVLCVMAGAAFGATPTTTSLMVAPSLTAKLGAAVTLTASVSPTPTGAGKVTFYDAGNVVGIASVSSGTATFTTRLLGAGEHSLTARFDGNVNDSASTSTPAVAYAITAGNSSHLVPAANLSAGMYPKAVAVGKFDGAHSDLAVVNWGSNSVSVLLGQGDGTFLPATPPSYSVGSLPESVAIGEFNGDGVSDLAVANSGDNTVTILLGNGGGKFHAAAKSTFAAGTSPLSVVVGDFNGDGIEDLAVADSSSAVSILLGKGDGTFTEPAITISNPSLAPSSLAVADFNGDGLADLVVANAALGTVSVLVNKGTTPPTFQIIPAPPLPMGSRPYFVTAADVSGDGKPDVAIADFFSGQVFVFTGQGGGMLNAPIGYGMGVVPYSIAVGDVNGDGNLDLVVAYAYSNNVTVLFGDGTGKFLTSASYPASILPDSVAVGKFNTATGDARTDVVVANFFGAINILLGTK